MIQEDATTATPVHAIVLPSMFPLVSFDQIELVDANKLLVEFGHKMGPLNRGNQGAWCFAMFHNDEPVGVVTASWLIGRHLGGCDRKWNRDNTLELSRLAAARSGLCRVVLRAWREFVLPAIAEQNGFIAAASYQDTDQHTGNTYRFDGWKKIGKSSSGTDTRSCRPGRKKAIWLWELDR
jgi:antitoxin VapB